MIMIAQFVGGWENLKFKVSLGYTARVYLKKKCSKQFSWFPFEERLVLTSGRDVIRKPATSL